MLGTIGGPAWGVLHASNQTVIELIAEPPTTNIQLSLIYHWPKMDSPNADLGCRNGQNGGAVVQDFWLLDGVDHQYLFIGNPDAVRCFRDGKHIGTLLANRNSP